MSLKEKENASPPPPTENLVADYLKNNPDFFVNNPSILAELKIPHEHVGTISLVEKQLVVLREQNQETHKKIHELIEIARQNEELAHRMHQLSLALMDTQDPKKVFDILYDNLKKNFHADKVVIRIFANPPCQEDSYIEEFVGKSSQEQELFKSIIEKREPLSGKMKKQQQVFLFGDMGNDIASSVMIPLHSLNWGGILAIGSFDPKRFQPGMGIELLGNLGEILSLIIKPWVEEN